MNLAVSYRSLFWLVAPPSTWRADLTGADAHLVVERDDVGNRHPHAAVRRVVADPRVLAGVDAVDSRAVGEPHPACFQRACSRSARPFRPGASSRAKEADGRAFARAYVSVWGSERSGRSRRDRGDARDGVLDPGVRGRGVDRRGNFAHKTRARALAPELVSSGRERVTRSHRYREGAVPFARRGPRVSGAVPGHAGIARAEFGGGVVNGVLRQ